jgi:putative endonuclease
MIQPKDLSRKALGKYGESLAARYLTGLGMTVLNRNWHGQNGEIDLILREGFTLVICEVKTRTSTAWGTPLEAVSAQKLDRLRRLAEEWISLYDVAPHDVRIDLVGVTRPRRGVPDIDHVRGVG